MRKLLSGWKCPECLSVEAVLQALASGSPNVEAKIKSSAYFGIIRGIPVDFLEDDIRTLIPKCIIAKQIGHSRSFRLQFESKTDLMNAIANPPAIGFEKIRVSEFLFLPPRCYKCQALLARARKQISK